MSKELEALKEYKEIKDYYFNKAKKTNSTLRLFENEDELYSTIETALKKQEQAIEEIDHVIEITTDFNVRMYLVAIKKVLL